MYIKRRFQLTACLLHYRVLNIAPRQFLASLLFLIFAVEAIAQPLVDSADKVDRSSGFREDVWYLPDESLLGFVKIPAGSFPMGSNPLIDPLAFENERWSDSRRQGMVELPLFYILRYEVTLEQYQAFLLATNYRVDSNTLTSPLQHPVTFVSWPDALAYARWLERQMRESELVPLQLRELLQNGWQITLPNEAQWEKAAKGGENRIYPWGNQVLPDRANYSGSGTARVGSYACPECSYGLHDMSGNVWEWTRSPYLPYPFDRPEGRINLEEDALWVIRGGSFEDEANNVRASVRGAADPGARRPFIGFRLVITEH